MVDPSPTETPWKAAIDRLRRVILALQSGNSVAPDDALEHARDLERLLSSDLSASKCFGLPPDYRSMLNRGERNQDYLELAAPFVGTGRERARQVLDLLKRHPKSQPPGRPLKFTALRKLLGQTAPNSNCPISGVKPKP